MGQPEEDKVDIFRTPESTPTTGQPTSSSSDSPSIKTNIEGSITTAPKSTGSGAQQALQRSSLVAPKSQVIKANIGGVNMPKAAGEALSDIKTAGQNLQSEADQYLAGTKSFSAPGEDVIKKGTSGDQEAFKSISDLLNQNVLSTEKFAPKTDIDIEKAAQFSTPAGIQGQLQREGGEEYTKGMGALDLSLLSQSPEFAQTLEAIKRGQDTLYSESDKAKKDLETQRLSKEQENLAAAQAATKGTLQKEATGLKDVATSAEKEFDNQIAYYQGAYNPTPEQKAKWDKERDDFINATAGKIMSQTKGAYGGYDYGSYLTPELMSGVDPYQFVKYTPQETDYTQFMSPEAVSQFNTIMGLLKQGGITQGLQPKQQFGFDESAYTKAILDAALAKKQQDEAVAAWKEAGGLEPPMDSIPAKQEMPYIPNVGSLAIPEGMMSQEEMAKMDVPKATISTSSDPNAFPGIGSLMLPGTLPEGKNVTIKSSSSNRYTNRPTERR